MDEFETGENSEIVSGIQSLNYKKRVKTDLLSKKTTLNAKLRFERGSLEEEKQGQVEI